MSNSNPKNIIETSKAFPKIIFEGYLGPNSLVQMVTVDIGTYYRWVMPNRPTEWYKLTCPHMQKCLSQITIMRRIEGKFEGDKHTVKKYEQNLENVLRNRPGVVFEHVHPDKSITQFVYINDIIYTRIVHTGHWEISPPGFVKQLSDRHFVRAALQPHGASLPYQGYVVFIKKTSQEELVDWIKILHDNPDKVYQVKGGTRLYRWHDYQLETNEYNVGWEKSSLTVQQFRQQYTSLVEYNPQEELKQKLLSVLPQGIELKDFDNDSVLIKKDNTEYSTHINSKIQLEKQLKKSQELTTIFQTSLKLIDILIKHNKQNS